MKYFNFCLAFFCSIRQNPKCILKRPCKKGFCQLLKPYVTEECVQDKDDILYGFQNKHHSIQINKSYYTTVYQNTKILILKQAMFAIPGIFIVTGCVHGPVPPSV